jgi:proline iminopeptidase
MGPRSGYPLLLLHGGPGLDHVQLRPWLDPLAERFRLIYVDQRAHGRSDPADPETWTLDRMARDLDPLAEALGLGGGFAILGHSLGAFVALQHAVDRGTATHYVLSGCVPSSRWLNGIERELRRYDPPDLRARIAASWDRETEVDTVEGFRQLLRDQLPFHFSSPGGEGYEITLDNIEAMRLGPEVLRHFAAGDHGAVEVEDRLGAVEAPVLVVAGDHDRVAAPEGAYAIVAGVPRGEYVVLRDAGHMMFAERPAAFRRAVTGFFDHHPQG